MIKRIHSLLSDNRMPHFIPYTLVNSYLEQKKLKELTEEIDKLFVALTFDIEFHPVTNTHEPATLFLKKIRSSLKNRKSTFFVQGNMVEICAKELKKMQRNNEIGLHGYAHEVWGDEKWWIRKKSLKSEEKRELLEISLDRFKKNKIKRPRSFRAPYMIINNETLETLKEFMFKLDSSFPSYQGTYPLPYLLDKIIEIPVTANTVPKIKLWPFPHSRYEILTTHYLASVSDKALMKFLQSVIAFQTQKEVLPHLVFLMHPWEFTTIRKEGFLYCSEKNYSVLEKICRLLEKNYKVNYVTMNRLGRTLKKQNSYTTFKNLPTKSFIL